MSPDGDNSNGNTVAADHSAVDAVPDVHDRITEAYFGQLGEELGRSSRERIHWICSHATGAQVLDVGCSQGISAILLGREGKIVTGVDVARRSIDQARDFLAQEPLRIRENVSFVCGDFLSFNADAGPFDTVILGEVLEHLTHPEAFVRAAAERLAEGGRLIVTVPYGVNDFPDHKQTFYLAEPWRLISQRFSIEEVEFFGKWIGFVGQKRSAKEDASGELVQASLVAEAEAVFQKIERDLTARVKQLSKRAYDVQTKLQAATKEKQKLHEQISENQTARQKSTEEVKRSQAELDEMRLATEATRAELKAAEMQFTEERIRFSRDTARLEGELSAAAQLMEQFRIDMEKSAEVTERERATRFEQEKQNLLAERRIIELSTRLDEVNTALSERADEIISLNAHVEQLRAERTDTDLKIAEIGVALTEAKGQVQQMRKKVDSEKQTARNTLNKLEVTEAQKQSEQAKNEELQRELQQAASRTEKLRNQVGRLQQQLAAAERQTQKTRNMISFQLGDALIQATKSWQGFAALPKRLKEISRDAKARRGSGGVGRKFALKASNSRRAPPTEIPPPAPSIVKKAASAPVIIQMERHGSTRQDERRTYLPVDDGQQSIQNGFLESKNERMLLTSTAPVTFKIDCSTAAGIRIRPDLQSENGDDLRDQSALIAVRFIQADGGVLKYQHPNMSQSKKFGNYKYLPAKEPLILPLPEPASSIEVEFFHWKAGRNVYLSLPLTVVLLDDQECKRLPENLSMLQGILDGFIDGNVDFESVIESARKVKSESYTADAGKICYVVHNCLPYASGGYATRAHGLLQGWKALGYDVVCVSRPGFPIDLGGGKGEDIPSYNDVDGITYHHITAVSYKSFIGQDYLEVSAGILEEKFRELRPQIVVAASNYRTALPALIAARRLGIKFVYEVRGFWEVTRISREPSFAKTGEYRNLIKYETTTAKYADHVFTLTSAMCAELVCRGVPLCQISLLPNSCDPQRFTPRCRDEVLADRLGIPPDVPVIGYIGSFVQYEGLENLAQAGVILAQRGLDFRLLLVGNENVSSTSRGPITEEILRLATEEGLANRLIMPGRIPHEEVEAHYSLIDIAPFPRKPQPVTEMVSPLKPLEAFAMEKAVVASSVGALAEMVKHEETGLIFEKGNVEELADALGRLIIDPVLRRRLGEAGRTWVEQHRTWEQTAMKAIDDLSQRGIFENPSIRTDESGDFDHSRSV